MNELEPFSSAQKVSQIQFKTDDSILAALLTGGTIQIICFNTADGSLFSSLKDATQLNPNGATIVMNSNYIFLAATSTANQLVAIAINLVPFNIAGQIQIGSTNNYNAQSSAFISSTNNLYIAGVCSPTPSCISLAFIQVSYAPGGIFSTFQSPQITQMSLAFQNPKLSNWAGQALFMASEGVLSSNYGIILWRQAFPPISLAEGYYYSEGIPDMLKLLSIDSLSSSEIFVGYKNQIRQKISILQVVFNSPAQFKNYLLQKPSFTLNDVSFIKVISQTAFYFSGSLQRLSSVQTGICLSMPGGQVAFLATSNIPHSCFPFSFNIATNLVFLTLNTSFSFITVSTSSIASTVSLSGPSPAITRINDAKLYQTLNQCCNVQINTASMPNHKYIVDTPLHTYSHPPFSIVSNPCTDFTFSYKRDISKMSTFIDTSAYIFFNDNPSILSFQAYTSDPLLAGSYKVQLTGYLPNHQSAQAPPSYIELYQISSEYIIPSSISDLVYIVSSPTANYKFKSFTQSQIPEYSLFYQMEILTTSNSWSSYLDPSLLIFKQDLSIAVYTTSSSFVGTHQLRLKAKFTPNAIYSESSQFKLTVVERNLKTTTIKAKSLPQIEITQTDTENTPLIVTNFKLWKDTNNGLSGKVSYSLSQANGLPIPSFMQFQKQILSLVIFQKREIEAGTYQFKLVREIKNPSKEIQTQELNEIAFFNIVINKKNKIDIPEKVIKNSSKEQKKQNDTQLSGKIISINETGAVTIKFSQPIMKVQNYSSIDNKVLRIEVQKPEKDKRDVLIDEWKVTMMSQNIIKIQLNFNLHQDISATDIMDTLIIQILDDLFFLTISTNGTVLAIKNNLVMKKPIPRQLKPQHIIIMTIAQYIAKGITQSALICGILSYLSSQTLIQLMGLLNLSQILLSMPLINISFPPNAQIVYGYLKQLITLNVGIDTDKLPGYNEALHFDESKEGFSSQFVRQGYESTNMIKNMGMSFVQLLLFLVWEVNILMINLFFTIFRSKAQWIKRKEKQAFFNALIIILQEGALELFLCSFINLLNYDFKTSGTERFSTSFGIFIQASILIMIISSFAITRKIIKDKKVPNYNERVAIIYEGLSRKNLWTINYHNLTVIRKIYLSALLVFLKDWALLQILAFYIQSVVFLIFVVLYQPMKDRKQWKIEVANEIAILMAALTLPAFTAQVDSEGQYFYGWCLSGILMTALGVNTIYNVVLHLIEIKEAIKRFINYIRKKFTNRKLAEGDAGKAKIYALEQLPRPRPTHPSISNNMSFNQFELEVKDINGLLNLPKKYIKET